ncbi:MAG: SCO family protein [Gaiellales bacterium]
MLAAVGLVAVASAGAGAVMLARDTASAVERPASAALRGDASWAPASRPAPAIALRDQHGRAFSLRSERGRVVMLTFLDSRCRTLCPVESRLLARVARSLPAAARPDVVVVSVDPAGDTPPSVRHALREFRGVRHATWLTGTRARLARVWREYGVEVKPVSGDIEHTSVLYLLDRRGDERAGMLFPFSPPSLAHDLALLAAEPAA